MKIDPTKLKTWHSRNLHKSLSYFDSCTIIAEDIHPDCYVLKCITAMKFVVRILPCVFILCCLATTAKPKPKKTFSIITYNVWNGFESETQRRNTFVGWARQQSADVIAFEELNHFTQASFENLAKTWGHPYAIIVKEDGYPVGISSRYPIRNICKLIEGMHHGCLYAEINGMGFFVVHFSPFSSVKRLQESNAILKLLKKKIS
ncbi:endonuclease/exonuclease/phosphatase family protein [Niabella ginsengisoli]|uniref:Endonuclease/exonuclease/phosphatase domain-containing protein n=1 Tax=Niabella ginsengisoli TaxID=522298 RepID=A0ABS9SKV4_9BACT|nr:endonuclease/exonuclease/phosphatase family protein [Niabella ginsengisoli]MCH5599018.1 hypothetical protein [Niabella ginsengisoli]